jgi:hypothetical protein
MEIAFFSNVCSFQPIGFDSGHGKFINLSERPRTVAYFDETQTFPAVTFASISGRPESRELLFAAFLHKLEAELAITSLPNLGIAQILLTGTGGGVGAWLTPEETKLYDDGGFDRSQPHYASAQDLLQKVIFCRRNAFMFPGWH